MFYRGVCGSYGRDLKSAEGQNSGGGVAAKANLEEKEGDRGAEEMSRTFSGH